MARGAGKIGTRRGSPARPVRGQGERSGMNGGILRRQRCARGQSTVAPTAGRRRVNGSEHQPVRRPSPAGYRVAGASRPGARLPFRGHASLAYGVGYDEDVAV